MPRRNDLHRIPIIGSVPLLSGQAASLSILGTICLSHCALDGWRHSVNSNLATIMTNLELAADRTYIEPLQFAISKRSSRGKSASTPCSL